MGDGGNGGKFEGSKPPVSRAQATDASKVLQKLDGEHVRGVFHVARIELGCQLQGQASKFDHKCGRKGIPARGGKREASAVHVPVGGRWS